MSPSDLPPEFRHAEPLANPTESSAKRRPSWWVAAPVGLLVLLGIIWSGVWYYAAGRAEAEIDAWIAAEAGQGRVWSCKDRQVGGYPFRFELMCSLPSLTLQGPAPVTWTARGAHAVAQGQEAAEPGREAGRRQEPLEQAPLEVAVGVDEARGEGRVAQVLHGQVGARGEHARRRPHVGDQAVADRDRAVTERIGRDRQDPGGPPDAAPRRISRPSRPPAGAAR